MERLDGKIIFNENPDLIGWNIWAWKSAIGWVTQIQENEDARFICSFNNFINNPEDFESWWYITTGTKVAND